ncbi:MAG: hypothetical protein K2H26_02130 [Ruminococcus sp.]|nr:hypothetical protein [Ruminococcus sp.]
MAENFRIPYNYKEGTFRAEEITDFSGETIDIEYGGCDVFRYILPEHYWEVDIYDVPANPVFTATYDSDGVIKHIELQRENRTDLVYIHFHNNEHAKEIVYKYSCYWGDWISEKILERKEKIARLFIDYSGDHFSPSILVNAYTPEDVQRTIAKFGHPYDDYRTEYYGDPEDGIVPDNETLRIMMMCTDENFCGELYGFAVYVMTERIKNKIDKSDDFKLILSDWD